VERMTRREFIAYLEALKKTNKPQIEEKPTPEQVAWCYSMKGQSYPKTLASKTLVSENIIRTKQKSGQKVPDYPYELTDNELGIDLKDKPTPEDVARYGTMRGQPGHFVTIRPEDRTPLQQLVYVRNLRYRTKFKEKRALKNIEKLEKKIEGLNPNIYPRLYVKINRSIKKNKDLLEKMLEVKRKYNF